MKSLTRDPAGNWAGKAMKNNVEIAVILEPNGNVRTLGPDLRSHGGMVYSWLASASGRPLIASCPIEGYPR